LKSLSRAAAPSPSNNRITAKRPAFKDKNGPQLARHRPDARQFGR